MEAPALFAQHHYRATVNIGLADPVEDVAVKRPARRLLPPDFLLHPLNIGDRIHGVMVNDVMQWDFAEVPVVGTCEETPGGDPGGGTIEGEATPGGSINRPDVPAIPQAAMAAGLPPMPMPRRSELVRAMLGATTEELAAMHEMMKSAAGVCGCGNAMAAKPMRVGPVRIDAAFAGETVWLRTGAPPVQHAEKCSIQLVPLGTWSTAQIKVVTRVHPSAQPVEVAGAATLTNSSPDAMQIDVTSLPDVGLQVTTAEGAGLEIDAYAAFGGGD